MMQQKNTASNQQHSVIPGDSSESFCVTESGLQRKVKQLELAFNQQLLLVMQQLEMLDQLKKDLEQVTTCLEMAKNARQVHGDVPLVHIIVKDKSAI